MRFPARFLFATALILGAANATTADVEVRASEGVVVALLVDGLNGAMIEHFETPSIDRLRAEGAWSHAFAPTFPAISGPTWVSASTGCWPARHGMVTDKFWDSEMGLMDHSGDPKWLLQCELLQQLAERQGVVTAALGWWGQWSPEGGPTATFISSTAQIEQQVPRVPAAYPTDDVRADEIVGYLERASSERPRLILGYLHGPDFEAHFDGFLSHENGQALERCDAAIGTVLAALEALQRREGVPVTLLLFSDHGMVPVHHIVNLPRIMNRHDIDARAVTTGTTGFLYFEDNAAVPAAVDALSPYDEFEVFRRGSLPEYMHLGESSRVPDLIIAAKPGYYTADPELWPWYLRPLGWFGPDFVPSPIMGAGLRAAHGYAPGTPGNDGVFYAWGDGIEHEGELETVRMIDVQPTIAALLGIEPAPDIDGVALNQLLRGTLDARNGANPGRPADLVVRAPAETTMQPRGPAVEAQQSLANSR